MVFTLGTALLMAVVSALFLLTLRGGLTGNLDTTLLTRTADAVAQLEADPSATVATEASNGIFVQILSPAGTVVDGADVLGTQTLLSPAQARAASTGTQTFDRTLSFPASSGASDGGTDDLRVAAVPGPGGTVVAAGTSRDGVDNAVRRAGIQLLVLALTLVAVAALGSWLLARAALRPVESMRRQAAALRTQDAGAGIDVPPGRDEVARLAMTFNDLLGRLRHAVDREQAFVADAGHELRTPLTVLQGELELAQRPGRTVAELQDTVAVAAFETDRLVRLAEDLLVLARTGDLDRRLEKVDLVELVRDAVATAGPAEQVRVHLRQHDDGPAPVTGHGPSLRRAVDNVLANALRYAPESTGIEIDVVATPLGWTVTVRDHGPGFPPAFLPQAFERFTQADQTRARGHDDRHPHGSGLGLAIVATIMTAHGGTATACNAASGGAVVELAAPCGPPQT